MAVCHHQRFLIGLQKTVGNRFLYPEEGQAEHSRADVQDELRKYSELGESRWG
jgi:hypothetical protein